MNVLEVVSARVVNGAAAHVRLLARELRTRGHGVTVAARPGSWNAEAAATDGLAVVPSDLHRWPPDELRRFAALVKERRIDVIHTHMSRAHLFGVLLRRVSGVPCVATAHSVHVQPHFAFNDRVIAVSGATARFHRRWNLVPKSRLHVVHNFVDVSQYTPAPGTRERVRASLGLGPKDIAIGAVGAIVPEKGLDLLVAAAPAVVDAVPRARFVLVGGGPAGYAARLRSATERLGVSGSVLWLGPREDVPDVLSALDVFVMASHRENLPMALLEAMAAGLPAVATAVGGVPELVAEGETCLLVPPSDPQALAAALVRLATDPETARRLGAAGRVRAAARFSAATQVPLVEAVLERARR